MPDPVPDQTTDQTAESTIDPAGADSPLNYAPLTPAVIPFTPLRPSTSVPDPVYSAFDAFTEARTGIPSIKREIADIDEQKDNIEAVRQAAINLAEVALEDANNRQIEAADRLNRLQMDQSRRAQGVVDVMAPFISPA